MRACRDQARDMRHVDHQICAHFMRDSSHAFEVDDARIRRCAANDQLRFAFLGQTFHLVVIDTLGLRMNAIGDELIILAREVHRRAMGQMSAMIERKTKNGVAQFDGCLISCQIRIRATMGLNICKPTLEKLFGAIASKVFYDIDLFTTAIITFARIAFCIFIGKHAAHCFHDSRRCEVL